MIASLRPSAGIVTDLGGACEGGGEALVGCARTGNAEFRHVLRGAAPSSPSLLALGSAATQVSCGPCSLVVDPVGAIVLSTGLTDATGRVERAMPLPAVPSLVGAALFEQWLVLGPPGCPQAGLSLSNGLRVEIQ